MKSFKSFYNLKKVSIMALFFGFLPSTFYGQCTFGNVSPGFTDLPSIGANYILGVSYNCPSSMIITSLNLFGLGTNSQVQMAIYSDNMGVPGNLLAESEIGIVGNGIVSLSIPPTALAAGDYWIMGIYPNDGSGVSHTYYTTLTSKDVYYQSLTFGSSLPTDGTGFLNYCCQDIQYWADGSARGIDTKTECDSYTWIDGNIYTSNNNTATFNIVGGAENGCDSIVRLDLTINNVSDLTTNTSDLTITSNNDNAVYQWLNCDNAYELISNETGQAFTATVNGNYAIELTENGCVDTSDCIAITTVGIIESDFSNGLSVFPNPTDGDFSIDLGSLYDSVEILISEVNGKIIRSESFHHVQFASLQLGESSGIYLITISVNDRKDVIRLVKN